MSKFFIFWYEYPCPLWSTPTVYPNLISFGLANADAAPKIEKNRECKIWNISFWLESTEKIKTVLNLPTPYILLCLIIEPVILLKPQL